MPYNLMRTLADSTKITENVQPKPIIRHWGELQQGFAGGNVRIALCRIEAGNTLMSTIERQRGQVSAILHFSDKYIDALLTSGRPQKYCQKNFDPRTDTRPLQQRLRRSTRGLVT